MAKKKKKNKKKDKLVGKGKKGKNKIGNSGEEKSRAGKRKKSKKKKETKKGVLKKSKKKGKKKKKKEKKDKRTSVTAHNLTSDELIQSIKDSGLGPRSVEKNQTAEELNANKTKDRSTNYRVYEGLLKLRTLQTIEKVKSFVEGETRKSILNAVAGVLRKLEKRNN